MVAHSMSADEIIGSYEGISCPLGIDPSEFEEFFTEEANMPDNDNGNEVTLETLQAQMSEVQTQLQAAQGQIDARDQQIVQLRNLAAKQFVDGIVLKAENYRDDKGHAHGKVFLDWLGIVLMCSDIGEGEEAIQLENKSDVSLVHAYYRRAIDWLATNMPGIVPVEPAGSEGDKKRPVQMGAGGDEDIELSDDDKAEITAVWRMV
jgi:hypothetical protein